MKKLNGIVTSTKMEKTAVIEVKNPKFVPIYKKRIWVKKKYHVHNEMGAQVGDKVIFAETKPISKTKKWIITDFLSRKLSSKEPVIKEVSKDAATNKADDKKKEVIVVRKSKSKKTLKPTSVKATAGKGKVNKK